MDFGQSFLEWRERHGHEPLTVENFADAVESFLQDIDTFIEELDRKKDTREMGAFDTVPNITIPDPDGGPASKEFCKKHGEQATAEQEFREKWGWEPHEQVIIRGAFTAADQEAVGNAANRYGKKGKPVSQLGTGRLKLLEQMIVDWTLAQNGRKVDVTPQNIRRLPANYSNPILEKCDEMAVAMSEEEQEDFLPAANGHSEESSTTAKPPQKQS